MLNLSSSRRSKLALLLALALPFAGCATEREVKKKPKKVVKKVLTPAEKLAIAMKEGDDALKAEKYGIAESKYDAALALDGKSKAARLGLAKSKLGLKKTEGAEALLKELRGEDPKNRELAMLLADALMQHEAFKEAVAIYEEMLKEDAHDKVALNNLIALYRVSKNYKKAESMATAILARDKDNVAALTNLSLVYYEQEKFNLSKTVAARSLKINDKDARLYNNQGMIEVKKGNLVKAIPFFEKAVKLDKTLIGPHLNIGSIALRFRDYKTSTRHYTAAVKLEPRHEDANLGLGYSLAGQQKGKEAVTQLVLALEISGKELTDVVAEVSYVYKLQMNDLAKSLEWANRYKKAKGGKLADDDAMTMHLQNLENEIEAAKMAADAEAEASAAEAAAPAAAPAPAEGAAAPAPAEGAAAPAPAAGGES
ncbi:MAG: tetratricopeptide repeat protein [Deltaproteobacteria bacterium]|nr:tetratricopeptide repeat protein [Deltaproteobacteria bacterium]